MATGTVVNTFKQQALQAQLTAATDLKVMLLTGSHTPNDDTDEFIDDVSANETSGIGYTAGGQSIVSESVSLDTANDRAELTCDDIVWNGGGSEGSLTARYAYLYDDTGTPGTSRIWGYLDQGAEITATNAPYTVDPSASDGFIAIG